MKIGKQIRQVHDILDQASRDRRAHREALKHLLGKMRAKEKGLAERLGMAPDEASREALQRKIDVLHAQRRKGVMALRQLGG